MEKKIETVITKALAFIKLTVINIKTKRRIAILTSLGIVGLGLAIFGIIALLRNQTTYPQEPPPVLSSISVSEVSEKSAVISWVTDKPTLSSVQVYSQNNMLISTVTEKVAVTEHRISIDGLSPNTTYNFQISDILPPLKGQPFTTLTIDAAALVLDDIKVSYQDARVIIGWVTNKPASGEIEYWTSDRSDKRMISSEDLTPIHFFDIAGVDVDKLYHYRVVSKDTNGNQATSEEGTFTLTIPLKVGTLAPDFTLQSIDGTSVTLSSYRGKPVMLYFWSFSCPECREKLSVIQEAFEKLPPDKLTILAIHPKVEETLVRNFVANEDITFNILLDQQELVKKLYKVKGLAANFFIDSDGNISKIDAHFHNEKELENIFADVLSTE
jgi:peroxiredoxin